MLNTYDPSNVPLVIGYNGEQNLNKFLFWVRSKAADIESKQPMLKGTSAALACCVSHIKS